MSPPSDFPWVFSWKQKISPVFHDKLQRLQVGETILRKNQAGHHTAPGAKIHRKASGKAILGVDRYLVLCMVTENTKAILLPARLTWLKGAKNEQ